MSRRAKSPRSAALPLAIVAALLLTVSGLLWVIGGAPTPARSSVIGGPFALVDQTGRAVTDKDFLGRHLLIYFGYSQCRDVCPVTLANVSAALDGMGAAADRIQPLFISVDPSHDAPAVLRDYLAGFSPRLIGLTGTPDELSRVARAYRLPSAVHGDKAGAYTIDHASVLYLVGPDGRFVAPLAADSSAPDLAKALSARLK